MRNKQRISLYLITAAALSASCSPEPDSVAFSPSKGDVRSYQVHSVAEITTESSSRRESLRLEQDAVVRYEVLGTGRTLRLGIDLTATEFWLNGEQIFTSTEPGRRASAPMRELMSAGFEVDIERKTGAISRFTSRNEDLWQTIIEDGTDLVLDELKQQMNVPGITQPTIPLTEGAQIVVADFRGADSLQLTVERVTESEVVTALLAENDDIRLVGTMVLERGSGWLSRMALVSEAKVDQRGVTGTSRQKLVILPEESHSSLGKWLLHTRPEGNEGFDFDPAPSPGEFDAAGEATDEMIVPVAVGDFFISGKRVILNLEHGFSGDVFPGRFELKNLQLHDARAEAIELELFRLANYNWLNRSLYQHMTHAEFAPLGWDDHRERLRSVERITATGHYQPVTVQPLTLPLDTHKKTEIVFDGIHAEAEPTGAPGEFVLRFHNTQERWLSHRIHGLAGARGFSDFVDKPIADWIDSEEWQMLRLVALNHHVLGDMRVEFHGEVPEALTLFALGNADTPSTSYALEFLSEEARFDRLDLPPSTEIPLYEDDDIEGPASAALGELELPQARNNRLSLSLPATLVGLCEIAVVDAPTINNRRLTWRQLSAGDNPDHLPAEQRWEISTEDGVRQYFYGIELHSAIQCRGRGEWQEVPVSLGDRPWLLDPAQLAGEVDPGQPMADFLRRYRFIGQGGQALAVMPPTFKSKVSLGVSSVGDYLAEGRWLRLAGRVQRVERLNITGEPEERRWSVEFAPLP